MRIYSILFSITSLLATNSFSIGLTLQPNDNAFDYSFEIPNYTYHKYCKSIYCQNGEDGILEQILKELNISAGTFCEFGASDGITSSNTYNLIKNHNFSGIAIELDAARFAKCKQNYTPFEHVKVYQGGVFYNDPNNNLNSWLKKGNLPYDFDILSIDIDCDDYYVWENLTDFMPKIVILETNPYRDPVYEELPNKPSQEYNIDLLQQWRSPLVAVGCSFISAIQLGLKKGYIPISHTGNISFIRKDLIYLLKEFPYLISDDPYDYLTLYSHLALWNNRWMTNTGLILNVAIRDYYLTFKKKHIDIEWLNIRMKQIANNENVIF